MTIATYIQDIIQHTRQQVHSFCDEFQYECIPTDIHESAKQAVISVFSNMHVPFLPPFHRPGWLLRYVIGHHHHHHHHYHRYHHYYHYHRHHHRYDPHHRYNPHHPHRHHYDHYHYHHQLSIRPVR